MKRYRIIGTATVDVVVWVEARSESDAIAKARELDSGRWKTLHAGHFDDVDVGFVTDTEPPDGESTW